MQAWTSDAPFGYRGRYYQVEDSYAEVRSPQQPRIPLYFGGSSEAGLPGRRQARRRLRPVGRAAGGDGRADRLGARRRRGGGPHRHAWDQRQRSAPSSARPRSWPGSGPTGSWPRPRRTSTTSRASGAAQTGASAARSRRTVGSQRLLAAAEPRASCTTGRCGRRWPPPPAPPATRPRSSARPRRSPRRSSTTLDIGVTTILIRGYDPYNDAIDYGRHLLPLVREEVARRDAEKRAADGSPPGRAGGAGMTARQRQLKLGAVTMGVGGPGQHYLWLDPEIPGDASVNVGLVHRAGPAGRGGQVRPDLHRRQPVHHRRLAAALPQPARADDAAVGPRRDHPPPGPGRAP